MNSKQNASGEIKRRSPLRTIALVIGIAAGIIIFFGCVWVGVQVAGGIALGLAMSSGGGTVLHSDPNPDHSIVVHAVSDDCGALCDCSTRIDLSAGGKTIKAIYRVHDSCDVEIRWLDRYRFEVADQRGTTVVLDARDYPARP